MAKNSTGAALRQVVNQAGIGEESKPVTVVHCYNVSATCVDDRAAVTTTLHDTPASAASVRSGQLHALLCIATESLDCAPADLRDKVLSLATDLAREVRALCELAAEVA